MPVGIEALNFYAGQTFLDVRTLFEERGLNIERFNNLMMNRKAVGLPCEDPVTHAVNAARPIVSRLTDEERGRIELVIAASESGLDFGKALSTYVHDHLGLSRQCRIFEVKQACYGGTAAVQMALGFVASGASPGAKALVVATDVAVGQDHSTDNYAEPSMGTGAAAVLLSDAPRMVELDLGANGYYSYEVMDTCRPVIGAEYGDVDLSLLTYLDCLSGAYDSYARRVEGADYAETFRYLAFHTPFAGMVKGAHRRMMLKLKRATPDEIEEDFKRRVVPSLKYCTQVGNVYSGTVYLALCGVIDQAAPGERHRVGMFSYGSGCSSEFYSGVVQADAGSRLRAFGLEESLAGRHALSFEEYERLLAANAEWGFGVADKEVDPSAFGAIYERQLAGKGLLVLKRVRGFHREYALS
jgi:polyketide biosynthesis 3-hydroxy-3-methylglutaryl-CoA synthase-like enzyme PksG